MKFYKKLFLLWDRHTAGFCRVLLALMIPAAIWRTFADVLCVFLLIMWLITKTGYEQKWSEEE